MKPITRHRSIFAAFALLVLGLANTSLRAAQPREGRITVAVAVADLEPIVRAVGGGDVETTSLFRGCILRKDLQVESAAKARLAGAEAIVWTGFLNESAAISAVLRQAGTSMNKGAAPQWIDVSRSTIRTNLPTSNCTGYIDPAFAAGDPFFWLNPENGGTIARHIALGLAQLRPAQRATFMANAETFRKALAKDIDRWKQSLKPLKGLRIFSAQCGWQNFSVMGGPQFVVCKGTPGELPSPQSLLLHIREMKADLILVDPNTPPEYREAFQQRANLPVVEVPSSIESIHGAATYSALFENLVRTVLAHAKH